MKRLENIERIILLEKDKYNPSRSMSRSHPYVRINTVEDKCSRVCRISEEEVADYLHLEVWLVTESIRLIRNTTG